MLDPEDYEMDNTPKNKNLLAEGDQISDFTGRELIMSSLGEKCYHEELKKSMLKDTNLDFEELFVT